MSQAQIDATVLLCRLLDREPPETAGLDFFTGANEAAGAQLLRERLLVIGPLLEWVTCPECRIELARVVRDESAITIVLLCPECWEVTAPRRVRETCKVALSRLVASLLNGLGLSPSGLQPLEPDVSWRLGTTEARRGQPVTWYFARRLRQA